MRLPRRPRGFLSAPLRWIASGEPHASWMELRSRNAARRLLRKLQEFNRRIGIRKRQRTPAITNLAVQRVAANLTRRSYRQFTVDAPEGSARAQVESGAFGNVHLNRCERSLYRNVFAARRTA